MDFNDEELLEITDALNSHICNFGGTQKEKNELHDRIKNHLKSKGIVLSED